MNKRVSFGYSKSSRACAEGKGLDHSFDPFDAVHIDCTPGDRDWMHEPRMNSVPCYACPVDLWVETPLFASAIARRESPASTVCYFHEQRHPPAAAVCMEIRP